MNGKTKIVNRIKSKIKVYTLRDQPVQEAMVVVIDDVVYRLTDEGKDLTGEGIAKDFNFGLIRERVRELETLSYKTLISLNEMV